MKKPAITPAKAQAPSPMTEERAYALLTAALLAALPSLEDHLRHFMTEDPECAAALNELAQQALNAAADMGSTELLFPVLAAAAASIARVARESQPWSPGP
jgi:hypothetical protein